MNIRQLRDRLAELGLDMNIRTDPDMFDGEEYLDLSPEGIQIHASGNLITVYTPDGEATECPTPEAVNSLVLLVLSRLD